MIVYSDFLSLRALRCCYSLTQTLSTHHSSINSMARRPWDDMGTTRSYGSPEEEIIRPKVVKKEERTFENDMKTIGKHGLFGGIIGGISGISLAGIEIVRDPKAITAGSGAGSRAKVARYGMMFGGFFTAFHGFREILKQNVPPSDDKFNDFVQNTSISAAACMLPVLMQPRMRTMIPYAVVLIGLDSINAYTEGDLF